MKLTEEEVEAQASLLAAMKAAKVQIYKTVGGIICTRITGQEKVKVKSPDQNEDRASEETS